MSDLYEIKRAFFDVLRGMQHPRITYPPELPGQAPDPAAAALLGQSPREASEQAPVGPAAPERGPILDQATGFTERETYDVQRPSV